MREIIYRAAVYMSSSINKAESRKRCHFTVTGNRASLGTLPQLLVGRVMYLSIYACGPSDCTDSRAAHTE